MITLENIRPKVDISKFKKPDKVQVNKTTTRYGDWTDKIEGMKKDIMRGYSVRLLAHKHNRSYKYMIQVLNCHGVKVRELRREGEKLAKEQGK